VKKIIVLFALLSLATRASALEVEGQTFSATHSAGGTVLSLHNVALLKVKLFFKVYAAGLYLADEMDATRVLADVPKRLEIAYIRDIPKEAIIQAAEDHLGSNFKPEQITALRDRLDAINKLYTDVKKGDRYALTYRPGAGCELSLNGTKLGVIPGADFAAAYFSIWLGPGCARPEFRDALLLAH
jgi:hypothetical protein